MPRRENGDADESHEESEEKDIVDKAVHSDPEDDDDDPPSGDGLSEEIYEVESIISHQYKRSELFFKVRWKNYSEEYDTVEPASNLTSASIAIQEYWQNSKNTQTPGKPAKRSSASSSKAKNDKKTPAKSANKESSSTSRSKRAEKSTAPVEPEPSADDDLPSDKEEEEDEDYDDAEKTVAQSSKKKRPVTKGALKAYESPKTAAPPVMSTPKLIAIKARSGWLLDESDDSDAEESAEKAQVVAKKDNVKRKSDETSSVPPPAKKPATQNIAIKEEEDMNEEQPGTIIGVFNQNGICKMVIADGGEEKLISLKDAHDRFGFSLVNYLADKVIGKV